MRKIQSAVLLVGLLLGAWVTVTHSQDTLSSLGVREDEAQAGVVESLRHGSIPVYHARNAFLKASGSARAVMAKGAIAWAKAYAKTDAFKVAYEKARQESMPTPPSAVGTVDDQIAKERAERRKSLEETKQSFAQLPAEMRQEMESVFREMEEQIANEEADPEGNAMLRQALEQERVAEQQQYQSRLAEYEDRYPADPRILLARRLSQFLDVSKDVDFEAELVLDQHGRKRFAKPEYEHRPDDWKLCYRAGKEPVQAARESAVEWLKELEAR
jgi:hypothetical protein